jgi:hypothetical protein
MSRSLNRNVLIASLYNQRLWPTVRSTDFSENKLSNQTLERIEQELRLMNINMAEANDIATLAAFPTMPADLDNDSRKALQQLRKKVMKRARTSADI